LPFNGSYRNVILRIFPEFGYMGANYTLSDDGILRGSKGHHPPF